LSENFAARVILQKLILRSRPVKSLADKEIVRLAAAFVLQGMAIAGTVVYLRSDNMP